MAEVLVTVGTTLFEELIMAVGCTSFLAVAKAALGTRRVTIQYGTGTPPFSSSSLSSPDSLDGEFRFTDPATGIEVHAFRLSPDFGFAMTAADVVITHCGAGSLFEALNSPRSKGAIFAVVNERLMDNHQDELAGKLEEMGVVVRASCDNLLDKIEGQGEEVRKGRKVVYHRGDERGIVEEIKRVARDVLWG